MNKKITLLLPILLLLGACSQSQQTEKKPTVNQPTGPTPIKCQWDNPDSSLGLYCETMPPEKKSYIVGSIMNDDEYNHYQGSVPSINNVNNGNSTCTLYRIQQQEEVNHDLVYGGSYESAASYNPYVYYMCKEDFEAIQPTLDKAEDVYNTASKVVFPKSLGNTLHILLLENSQYLSSSYLRAIHFKLREAVKTTPPTKD